MLHMENLPSEETCSANMCICISGQKGIISLTIYTIMVGQMTLYLYSDLKFSIRKKYAISSFWGV